jgi:poly-gamma-glutamate capsule biosynthesis protein CapA/YwtB (metallophosphatase superfamily)
MAALTACHRAPEKSAELWLGGDVNLGDGGNAQLQDIAGMVKGAAGIVNLEGPVSERLPQNEDRLRLWNAPQALAELTAVKVKVAGIANNHAADAGTAGIEETSKRLRDHAIVPAGATAGAAFLPVNGVSVAVTAHDLTSGLPATLEAELAAAHRRADVLVATFHVTGPPSYIPHPELKQAVEIAYRAGATVIAAHGAHALGPVERRAHAVIAWGLGNLAFACDCTKEEDAILLRVTVHPGKVTSAEVLPLQAGINRSKAKPSLDVNGIFDLLEAIGSTKLRLDGNEAYF